MDLVATQQKSDSSPVQEQQLPFGGKQLDMWDRRLALETKQGASSVTPTTVTSPAVAPAGGAGSASGRPAFKPLRSGSNPTEVPTNHMELLATALRHSPAAVRQVKYEIARLVLARGGSNAKPTEEEANTIVEMIARELAPASSTTPPDGRMTIDTELQWSLTKEANTNADNAVQRPNAPVNDAPQVVQEPVVTATMIENSIGGALVYSSDNSSVGANPIRPKPQVLRHANKETLQAIKRRGGLKPHSSRTSAFSEHSEGSFGSRTGSSVSKDYRAE